MCLYHRYQDQMEEEPVRPLTRCSTLELSKSVPDMYAKSVLNGILAEICIRNGKPKKEVDGKVQLIDFTNDL